MLPDDEELAQLVAPPRLTAAAVAEEPPVGVRRQWVRRVALGHQQEHLAGHFPLAESDVAHGRGERRRRGLVVGQLTQHRPELRQESFRRRYAGRRFRHRMQRGALPQRHFGLGTLLRRGRCRPAGQAARRQLDALHQVPVRLGPRRATRDEPVAAQVRQNGRRLGQQRRRRRGVVAVTRLEERNDGRQVVGHRGLGPAVPPAVELGGRVRRQAEELNLFGERLGVAGAAKRLAHGLGDHGVGRGTGRILFGVVRQHDVRLPHAVRQHELPEHLLGGVVAVEPVPGLHEAVAVRTGQVRADGKLPQRFRRGTARLPDGLGEPRPVGRPCRGGEHRVGAGHAKRRHKVAVLGAEPGQHIGRQSRRPGVDTEHRRPLAAAALHLPRLAAVGRRQDRTQLADGPPVRLVGEPNAVERQRLSGRHDLPVVAAVAAVQDGRARPADGPNVRAGAVDGVEVPGRLHLRLQPELDEAPRRTVAAVTAEHQPALADRNAALVAQQHAAEVAAAQLIDVRQADAVRA